MWMKDAASMGGLSGAAGWIGGEEGEGSTPAAAPSSAMERRVVGGSQARRIRACRSWAVGV